MESDQASYLMHYGVKGMRWGVIREKKDANRRRVAAKAVKRSQETSTEIESIRSKGKRIGDGIIRANPDTRIRSLEKKKARADADAKAAKQGKLTPTEKKVLAGAAVAVTVLAAYGAYAAADSGKFNAMRLGRGDTPFKKNDALRNLDITPEKAGLLSMKINPDYGSLGSTNNCRRCTFSYEMTRRGYQVEATKTLRGRGQNAAGMFSVLSDKREVISITGEKRAKAVMLKSAIDSELGLNTKTTRFMDYANKAFVSQKKFTGDVVKDHSKLASAFANMPNAARGEIQMSWKFGGAHSMAWEIMNGKPVIIDAQSHEVYKSISEFMVKNGEKIATVDLTRLDNVDLNPEILKRWMK